MTFSFKITHRSKYKNSLARTGIIKTNNGKVETPYLIPVATRSFIIGLSQKDIEKMKIPALLSNTYHLHLKPGENIIKQAGGLHKYMNFKGIIFTDSGGFQAMSLGDTRSSGYTKLGLNKEKLNIINKTEPIKQKLVNITEEGVHFKSIYDNSDHFFDAKTSMQIQSALGSDAIMAFDECTTANQSLKYQKAALERTNRWALESLKFHNKNQALYGIIQGGKYKSLRKASAKFILSQPFDGIAIGGSFGDSFGDSKKDMLEILDFLGKQYKEDNRPRHLLGIGWIDDIFECVDRGIDTFDCVHMTRIARHGNLYVCPESGGKIKNKFKIKIKQSKFKNDKSKIDKFCKCEFCKTRTRAEAHKLAKTDKYKFGRLATIHNIRFMLNLLDQIRQSINQDKFQQLKKKWLR